MLTHHVTIMIIMTPIVVGVDTPEYVVVVVSHGATMVIVIVTCFGMEPRTVEVEDLRCEGDVFIWIETERIVYPDKEFLQRQRNWAPFGVIVGEEFRLPVEDLRREDALLEIDDLSNWSAVGAVVACA